MLVFNTQSHNMNYNNWKWHPHDADNDSDIHAGIYDVRLSFLLMHDDDDDAICHENKNHAVITI